jgi:hypothetical protein
MQLKFLFLSFIAAVLDIPLEERHESHHEEYHTRANLRVGRNHCIVFKSYLVRLLRDPFITTLSKVCWRLTYIYQWNQHVLHDPVRLQRMCGFRVQLVLVDPGLQ